jgi:hypothetical protein
MKISLRSISVLGLLALITFTLSAQAQTLYGATGSNGVNGELVLLNPLTGAVTTDIGALVDASNNHYGVTGLRFQPGTGTLFGVTSNLSPTAPASLLTINPATGFVTLIGPLNAANGSPMGDIAFSSGTLYGANASGGALYSIDTATGAATRISAVDNTITSGSGGHGLAVAGNGTLYTTPDGSGGILYTYDSTTGAVALQAGLSGAPLAGAINALAFNGATLYGVDANRNSTSHTHLVTIDTTTGTISDIGSSLNDLDAIAFASPVPEPSTYALLGSLGLSGVALLRRRRKR